MKKAKIIKTVAAITIVAVISGGGYFAYNKYTLDKSREAMRTAFAQTNQSLLAEVLKTDLKSYVTSTGVVNLRDEQSVYSTGESKVLEVLVDVGDTVKENQELVTYNIETTRSELEKKIKEAEISLSNQYLSLETMTLGPTDNDIQELNRNIESAEKSIDDSKFTLANTQIKFDNQQSQLQKYQDAIDDAQKTIDVNKELLEVGAITEESYNQSLDTKKTAEDQLSTQQQALGDILRTKESNERSIATAESNLEYAKKKLEDAHIVLGTESDKIKYQQQQNQVKLGELNLADLKRQLSELVSSTISPLEGTITAVNVSRGSNVTNDTILIKVADFSDLIVKANISEYDAPNIELGQTVTMTSDGIPNTIYKGKIITIGNSASSQSAVSGSETVVPIEISVENVDKNIKPGYNLDLEILTVDKPSVLNIPVSSVVKDKETGKQYVFTIDESRNLKRVDVELGIQSDLNVEVISGLSENQKIVASPTDEMEDGKPLHSNTETNGGRGNANRANQNGQMLFPGGAGGTRSQGGAMPAGRP